MSILHTLLLNSATNPLIPALEAVGYHRVSRTPGPDLYVPTAPIRVELTTGPGLGHLTGITTDGWLEVQLDGETRRDEYLQPHVRPVSTTVEAACAAHGFTAG